MPADHSKPTRKSSRKVIEDEDLELKRIRGEISCAECRRLKLRCDKKVPCGSCVRRGCSSICPNGSLSSGQGTRFILADTEHLHRKIAEMSKRIRQLEDAVAIFQASVSSERHPLLSDDLLKIKFGPEAYDLPRPKVAEEPTPESVDALGTLSFDEVGDVHYYGRSAGSETLLLVGEESETDPISTDEEKEPVSIPPELARLANLIPFNSNRKTPSIETIQTLESYLPTQQRAWYLCEAFLDHASWHFRPFDKEELVNDLLNPIYQAAQSRASYGTQVGFDSDAHPHRLASLFLVFAVGSLVDLNVAPFNAEAARYHDLGRAALSLRYVFNSPQVETVQAVALLSMYQSLAGKDYSRDSVWSLMALAAKLAQSIGLHRDSSRWNLDAKTVQRRRALFWEIFTADTSNALALGRPPSIHSSYIDCEFPQDEEGTLSETGETQPGFWWWKHTFARDIFSPVNEATLTAKPPTYATILDLDRKVRQMTFPTSFKPYAHPGDKDYNSASVSIRSFYLSQHRTIIMLYIHRSFFAQAMLDHPANPLRSSFAPSFLAAYRCASIIIKAFVHQFERAPELTMRVWFLLNHTFSAAIIVGSVVSHCPSSSMAPGALTDLGIAVEVFEKIAIHSRRARVALRVLRKLRDKATRAYAQFRNGSKPAQPSLSLRGRTEDNQDQEDELAIFGGQTRVVSSRSHSRKPTPEGANHHQWQSTPSPPSATESRASENGTASTVSHSSDIHPSLMEYLDVLPGTAPPTQSLQDLSTIPFNWESLPSYSMSSANSPASSISAPPPSTTPELIQANGSNDMLNTSYVQNGLHQRQADIMDLGLTSESGMDEQWLSFMRDCGILDGNFHGMLPPSS